MRAISFSLFALGVLAVLDGFARPAGSMRPVAGPSPPPPPITRARKPPAPVPPRTTSTAQGVDRTARPGPPVGPALAGTQALVPVPFDYRPLAVAMRYDALPSVVRRFGGAPWRRGGDRQLFVAGLNLAPRPIADGLVLNLPAKRLFWLRGNQVIGAFPVAIGMSFDPSQKNPWKWRTPVGHFRVLAKVWHGPWFVPRDLQDLLHPPRRIVPFGDPDYPLGQAKLDITRTGIMIHGTDATWTVGHRISHGCIRVWNPAVIKLYRGISVGTRLDVVYDPVQVAAIGGRVWLEVDPDLYGLAGDLAALTREAIARAHLEPRVDPDLVASTVAAHLPIAVDVTRAGAD